MIIKVLLAFAVGISLLGTGISNPLLCPFEKTVATGSIRIAVDTWTQFSQGNADYEGCVPVSCETLL